MDTTMNVSGDFISLWYVIVPTLILVLVSVLSLSRELVVRLRRGWESLRDAWRAPVHGHGSRWAKSTAKT